MNVGLHADAASLAGPPSRSGESEGRYVLPRPIFEVARALMESRGGLGYCQHMDLPRSVADHDEKWIVLDRSEKPSLVVMLSPEQFPDDVHKASSRAIALRDKLGGAAAAAVVVPLHVGLCGGISFAITPYMRPVAGRGIRARWHRFRLRQKILSWLREVTQDTARAPEAEAVSTDFSDPLHHLAESDFLPDKVRSHARSALSDLESGRWKPVHVAAHNDLWAGNMLIAPDNATGPGFGVIDWGAARSEGHAVYDLVRVAMSLNITRTQFVKELAAHAKILDCDIAQMQHHLVSALAYLGDHRGEWPAERFAEMAKACVDYLESASSAAVHH